MRPFPSLMMMIPVEPPVVPATYYFTVPGLQTFTMVRYNTLVVELWGGGASTVSYVSGYYHGSNGVSSLFYDGLTTPTAGGGIGGDWTPPNGVGAAGVTGIGGTASGGDTNTSGDAGSVSLGGGGSPNGGGYANSTTGLANFPGGAADGYDNYAGVYIPQPGYAQYLVGGGGAYCKKTYSPGTLIPNQVYNIFVGSGATSAYYGYPQLHGANGQIKITIS